MIVRTLKDNRGRLIQKEELDSIAAVDRVTGCSLLSTLCG
jgi:hypothetical protein